MYMKIFSITEKKCQFYYIYAEIYPQFKFVIYIFRHNQKFVTLLALKLILMQFKVENKNLKITADNTHHGMMPRILCMSLILIYIAYSTQHNHHHHTPMITYETENLKKKFISTLKNKCLTNFKIEDNH